VAAAEAEEEEEAMEGTVHTKAEVVVVAVETVEIRFTMETTQMAEADIHHREDLSAQEDATMVEDEGSVISRREVAVGVVVMAVEEGGVLL